MGLVGAPTASPAEAQSLVEEAVEPRSPHCEGVLTRGPAEFGDFDAELPRGRFAGLEAGGSPQAASSSFLKRRSSTSVVIPYRSAKGQQMPKPLPTARDRGCERSARAQRRRSPQAQVIALEESHAGGKGDCGERGHAYAGRHRSEARGLERGCPQVPRGHLNQNTLHFINKRPTAAHTRDRFWREGFISGACPDGRALGPSCGTLRFAAASRHRRSLGSLSVGSRNGSRKSMRFPARSSPDAFRKSPTSATCATSMAPPGVASWTCWSPARPVSHSASRAAANRSRIRVATSR